MSSIDGRTARSAQCRAPNRNGWSAAKRATFLHTLAQTCNVTMAARAAKIGTGAAYQLRLKDAEFAALWAAAMETGYLRLEAALLQRAIGAPQGDNPDVDDVVATDDPPVAALDVELALKLLARRRDHPGTGVRRGDARLRQPTPVEVHAALARKIAAVERRLERQRERRPDGTA